MQTSRASVWYCEGTDAGNWSCNIVFLWFPLGKVFQFAWLYAKDGRWIWVSRTLSSYFPALCLILGCAVPIDWQFSREWIDIYLLWVFQKACWSQRYRNRYSAKRCRSWTYHFSTNAIFLYGRRSYHFTPADPCWTSEVPSSDRAIPTQICSEDNLPGRDSKCVEGGWIHRPIPRPFVDAAAWVARNLDLDDSVRFVCHANSRYELSLKPFIRKGYTRSSIPLLGIIAAGSIRFSCLLWLILSGAAYWASIYPIDTIKSILQTDTTLYKQTKGNRWAAVAKSLGIRGMFRGLGCTLIRAVPANAVLFLSFEYAYRVFSPFF